VGYNRLLTGYRALLVSFIGISDAGIQPGRTIKLTTIRAW